MISKWFLKSSSLVAILWLVALQCFAHDGAAVADEAELVETAGDEHVVEQVLVLVPQQGLSNDEGTQRWRWTPPGSSGGASGGRRLAPQPRQEVVPQARQVVVPAEGARLRT